MSFSPRPLARLMPTRMDPLTGLPGPTVRYVYIPAAVAASDEPVGGVVNIMELGLEGGSAPSGLAVACMPPSSTGPSAAAGFPSAATSSAAAVPAAAFAPAAAVVPPAAVASSAGAALPVVALPPAAAESPGAASPLAVASPSTSLKSSMAVMVSAPSSSTAGGSSIEALKPTAAGTLPTSAVELPIAHTPIIGRPPKNTIKPSTSPPPAAVGSSTGDGSRTVACSPVTPHASPTKKRASNIGEPAESTEPSPPGSPTTPLRSNSPVSSASPPTEEGLDPSACAILRSIALLGIELDRSARPPRSCNKVFIVLEYGDGSVDDPYDGRVIDCTTDNNSAEFEAAFREVWWTKRRPSLSASKKKGTSRQGVEADKGAPWASDAVCPSFSLHNTTLLLSIKGTPTGRRVMPVAMMDNALASLRLTSISQLSAMRVRKIFQSISQHINEPSGGRARWTWSQVCPLEMLTATWTETTDGSDAAVDALCLYPPWHNSVKIKLVVRRLALVLAATLSDFWMFFCAKSLQSRGRRGTRLGRRLTK